MALARINHDNSMPQPVMQEKKTRKLRIRKKTAAPAHEEGPWLMSYADMMTLLCCFFIIFFPVNDKKGNMQSYEIKKELLKEFNPKDVGKLKDEQDAVQQNAAKAEAFDLLMARMNVAAKDKTALVVNIKERDQSVKAEVVAEFIRNSVKEELGMEVRQNGNPSEKDAIVTVVLPSDMLFSSGKADISEKMKRELNKLAEVLKASEEMIGVEISGHTDREKPSSKAFYTDNWALSAARAGAVAAYLQGNGLKPSLIKAFGEADSRPLVNESDPDGSVNKQHQQRNRRIEIKVIRQPEKRSHGIKTE